MRHDWIPLLYMGNGSEWFEMEEREGGRWKMVDDKPQACRTARPSEALT